MSGALGCGGRSQDGFKQHTANGGAANHAVEADDGDVDAKNAGHIPRAGGVDVDLAGRGCERVASNNHGSGGGRCGGFLGGGGGFGGWFLRKKKNKCVV